MKAPLRQFYSENTFKNRNPDNNRKCGNESTLTKKKKTHSHCTILVRLL